MSFTRSALVVLALSLLTPALLPAAAPTVKLAGERRVEISYGDKTAGFDIPPMTWKVVEDEKYDVLPVFRPSGASWTKGRVLKGVVACECAVFGALDPESVVVKLASSGETLERGKDYQFDNSSGALGRIDGGKIGAKDAVLVSYRCAESRIDSIAENSDGTAVLVEGQPRVLSPEPPVLAESQKRLADIYTTGRNPALSAASLFPVDEVFAGLTDACDAPAYIAAATEYGKKTGAPEPADVAAKGAVKKYLPKTWEKLKKGETVRILAWGDSVTACGFLPDDQRWQIKLQKRLQEMFPDAEIVMLTEAWGGRNTESYRKEPPGSPKNYAEKVLALKPDLIISEFVNDAFMTPEVVAQKYGEIREDFNKIGAEWIILGPHFVRPDWMGLQSERDCDDDPRPYVKGLREFTAANNIPYADTPVFYGRLWRAGIPYLTLMTNNINHPNNFGMELFAAALANLFEE